MEFPKRTITKAGSDVLLLYKFSCGKKPLVGAYFEPESKEWLVCSWMEDGRYTDKGVSSLDIFINYEPKKITEVAGDPV